MGLISGLADILFARDHAPQARTYIGLPGMGGLVPYGVTSATAVGLSAVWRSLDILSNGVAQLDWRELRGNLDLPPSRLVRRPLGSATRREWTSFVVSCVALYDYCYLLKIGGEDAEGVPFGLLPVNPDQIMPKGVGTASISPFVTSDTYMIGGTEVPADQLVIIRRSPTPGADEVSGGVIRLARTTFAAALAAENYASRYWQAGGSPQTVLETDQQLPDPVATALSDKWSQRRSMGPDYAPVLSGGVKARDFGADPLVSAAVEARREQVADIGRYFGIPTRILNAPTGDSETYTSTEAGNGDLVRYTLQNYIGAIEDAISDLLPGGRVMRMDVSRLVAGTQLAQAQAYQLATGGKAWMTPEEVRDKWNLPPVELTPDPSPAEVPSIVTD